MTRPIIQIQNAETGEDIVREMNDDEFAAWQVGKSDRDSAQAKAIRADRDSRIAATDWKVLKALELGNPSNFELALYRQNLRDITAQEGFPWSVVWPTEPV